MKKYPKNRRTATRESNKKIENKIEEDLLRTEEYRTLTEVE